MQQRANSLTFAGFGLRGRLLLVSALASVPLFVALLHNVIEQRRAATREIEHEALRLTRLLADNQQRVQRMALATLAELASQPKVASATCADVMPRIDRQPDDSFLAGVVNAGGTVVCSSDPTLVGVNVMNIGTIRDALSTQHTVRGSTINESPAFPPAWLSAAPIANAAEQFDGAVFVGVPTASLSRYLADIGARDGTALTFADTRLYVLASRNEPTAVGAPLSGTELGIMLASVQNATSPLTATFNDDRLYSLTALRDDTGHAFGYLAIGVPSSGVLAQANVTAQRHLAIGAAMFTVMLLTAWWAGGAFVLRHVRALLSAFTRLEAGDLNKLMPAPAGNSELAQLANAFNRVVRALREREQQLHRNAEEIAALNRIHAVASSSSAAVLRIHDRQRLLEEICRIAVDAGQFAVAFVAEADGDGHRCRAAAWHGVSENEIRLLFDRMNQRTGDGAPAPALTALLENRYAVASEAQLDPPSLSAWCRNHNIGSWASFPLSIRGRCVGSLNLCAEASNFFDHEEVRLLQTVAADASFGLEFAEKERHRNYLAYYDALTDLPNRLLFLDRLERELHHARATDRSLAVLILSLRGFRRINDTLGRHVGDSLLSQAAAQLRAMVHDIDTFARIGHDEFGAILFDASNPTQAGDHANQILLAAPKYFRIDEHDVYVNWNGGVSLYPDSGADAHTLVKNAETASHSAARIEGSALLFYAPEMDQQARDRYAFEARLRDAIRRDELALHYQPVVDIHSGRTMSVEALLRWHHPELGPQSAAQFIPIAEETGLILPLGDWVITQACAQLREWRDHGQRAVPIALNLSAKQLQQADFAERLIAAIKAQGCDPADVPFAVEITESELMRNVKEAADVLLQLKQAGLSIYVDDFGTGYSSLSYLQQLPIDVLKIDRSFVQDLATNARTRAMVSAVINMAHTLGLRVIAEGVENHAELNILREMGCDAVQGYLFSVPGAANDIEPLLSRNLLHTAPG